MNASLGTGLLCLAFGFVAYASQGHVQRFEVPTAQPSKTTVSIARVSTLTVPDGKNDPAVHAIQAELAQAVRGNVPAGDLVQSIFDTLSTSHDQVTLTTANPNYYWAWDPETFRTVWICHGGSTILVVDRDDPDPIQLVVDTIVQLGN
jgi:hypothetical protein